MITEMIKAVKAGEELKDPAKWKNRVETINLVGIVLAAIVLIVRWKYPSWSYRICSRNNRYYSCYS